MDSSFPIPQINLFWTKIIIIINLLKLNFVINHAINGHYVITRWVCMRYVIEWASTGREEEVMCIDDLVALDYSVSHKQLKNL